MEKIYTDAQWGEIWEEGLQTGETSYHCDDIESVEIWQLPFRKSLIRKTPLCLGLQTLICNSEHSETVGCDFVSHDSYVSLGFRSAGIFKIGDVYCEQPGESCLIYQSEETREIEKSMAGRDVNAIIRLEPHLLRLLSVGQEAYLPSLLKPFLETETAPSFYQSLGKMTPAMQVALQQLHHCPFEGIMRRTYIEAKTLELITLQFAQLFNDNTPSSQSINFKGDDFERIYHARDILINNIANPLSLIDLARRVGLNDFKLKQGFRQIFGTTVFGYLHNYRLEQARQLLEKGDMKVGDVMRVVGWRDRKHFAAAFRKKFGLNPRDFKIRLS